MRCRAWLNFSVKVLVSHKTHFSHRGGSVTARPEIVFHAFNISRELFRLGECELCKRLAWLLNSNQMLCRRSESRNCLLLPLFNTLSSSSVSNVWSSTRQSTFNQHSISGIQPSSTTITGKLVSYVQHICYPLTTFFYRLQISTTYRCSTFSTVQFMNSD